MPAQLLGQTKGCPCGQPPAAPHTRTVPAGNSFGCSTQALGLMMPGTNPGDSPYAGAEPCDATLPAPATYRT